MTPRTEIFGIHADASYEEARRAVVEGGHSRIPVYEESLDHIIGVLYVKDLLRYGPGDAFDVRKAMRTPPYVPLTKSLHDLLNEFRANKVQIAIVLDEYGGTAGLATIEDILEELVGEIDDEYDQPEPAPMNWLDENTLEVDARVHVSEVNEALGVELPEDGDYETIGGFVFSTLGKIPARGEQFAHANLQISVLDAEPRKIRRLRLQVQRETESV
jgi:CBS domain containing-hemolysin-like protein